jgi:hypothetical protein
MLKEIRKAPEVQILFLLSFPDFAFGSIGNELLLVNRLQSVNTESPVAAEPTVMVEGLARVGCRRKGYPCDLAAKRI